ncbi:recombinase family protein [Megasphaera massiliensis]|uniref:recombinase family protein n=1 Tax=Megasphaera massiliensis TaxID=1232428 RepID=UPI003080D151
MKRRIEQKRDSKNVAVIYARYSSSKQREESIDGQLRVCHAFAENEGLIVMHEYIDRAMSARTDRRPDFLQMIQDSDEKNLAMSSFISWIGLRVVVMTVLSINIV